MFSMGKPGVEFVSQIKTKGHRELKYSSDAVSFVENQHKFSFDWHHWRCSAVSPAGLKMELKLHYTADWK